MSHGTLIRRGLQVTGLLMCAFGGFLTHLAPPDERGDQAGKIAVGVASTFILIVFLLAVATPKGGSPDKRKRLFVRIGRTLAGVAAITLLSYIGISFSWTGTYVPEESEVDAIRYVKGTQLTAAVESYLLEFPGSSIQYLLEEFHGPQNVWTAESTKVRRVSLIVGYVFAVVCTASSIVCLSEGALAALS